VRAILTFHGVDESGSVLSVSAAALEALLAAVREGGFEIVALERLLEAAPQERRVALSFDDGFASVHAAALPVLRAAGAPATLFLTSGHVGRDNRWPGQPAFAPTEPLLGWKEVEALAGAGFTIEAHTFSHPDLRRLSDDAIADELARADEEIERRLGRAPRGFAYPYGFFDARVVAAARRRYRYAVTTVLDWVPARAPDLHLLPRLDAFYLREPRAQRGFGGPRMRARIAARRWLRAVRARVAGLAHAS
jgi:peptidoglycan/xylan/chitin deacetylase (PgdA/CDA1 family)